MALLEKSQELKALVSTYDIRWFLGDLSSLMPSIANNRANDQLGKLSSPQRQLYYLAGLLMTSAPGTGHDFGHDKKKWDKIVELLNDIEKEYDLIFFPKEGEEIDEKWQHTRRVAAPTFLSYFNEGPLNYEEQKINWINDLYIPLNKEIVQVIDITVEELVEFYNNLDKLNQKNFQGHTNNENPLRDYWKSYTEIKMGVRSDAPEEIKALEPKYEKLSYFMSDRGIKDRFHSQELASQTLSLEKVLAILRHLSCMQRETEFIYYTSKDPSNPLYETPIVDLGDDMFQVFEVKQVIHAIENLLERTALQSAAKDRYVKTKGDLLESTVKGIFENFFNSTDPKSTCKVYQGYYVDGAEQDILILWKDKAFIIETKDYAYREPLRDPARAYQRIKDSFNNCVGYAYTQTRRVEEKFINQEILTLKDKKGKTIDEIDTSKFSNDFSIIVNKTSFGQIQCDLSILLPVGENDVFPWAIKLDDLETFILTLIQLRKKPEDLVDFLKLREELHGRIICTDELQICGAFLKKLIKPKQVTDKSIFVLTPAMATIFDDQYYKGLGLKNEKYWKEKREGKIRFI